MGGISQHDHHSIEGAIALARRISDDIQELGASGWIYWQAVENEHTNNDWGLIHAPFQGEEAFWKTKQYWAMAHFSRHVPPFSQSIGHYGPRDHNGITGAAFIRPDQTITTIIVNSANVANSINLQINGGYKIKEMFQTTAKNNYQQKIVNSNLVDVPPKSITTIISIK